MQLRPTGSPQAAATAWRSDAARVSVGSCLVVAIVHEHDSPHASCGVYDPVSFAKLLRFLHLQQAVFAKELVRPELGNFDPARLQLLREV
jgi:hypothetical protein